MPIQKSSAQNNGWTKKEAKIFKRNSVISQILHWLDWNRQLWSKDIYSILSATTAVGLHPEQQIIASKTFVKARGNSLQYILCASLKFIDLPRSAPKCETNRLGSHYSLRFNFCPKILSFFVFHRYIN